jgi:hypothetical protein
MRKGHVYDLGLDLSRSEIKAIFRRLSDQFRQGSQARIDQNDIMSGGVSLLEHRDKHTKMNLLQLAFWSRGEVED